MTWASSNTAAATISAGGLATGAGQGTSQIWLLYDYAPVYGIPGTDHSRNFLYADGHVD